MSLGEKYLDAVEDSSTSLTPAYAIRRLLGLEDTLIMKYILLRHVVKHELRSAKNNSTKNKRVALQALKRKKMYEKEIGQIDEILTTIREQCEALRNADTDDEVLKILEFVAETYKNAPKMDLGELIATSQEIANAKSDAISNPAGFDRDLDEVELAELEKLEQGELDEQLLAVSPSVAEKSSKLLPQLKQFLRQRINERRLRNMKI